MIRKTIVWFEIKLYGLIGKLYGLERNCMVSNHESYGLGRVWGRQVCITRTNVDPDLCHHMASLSHNKLNEPILLQKIGTTSTNWCATMFVFVETIETTTTTTISPGPDGKLISTEERMVQVRGGGEQSAHVTTTGEGPREVVVAGYQH